MSRIRYDAKVVKLKLSINIYKRAPAAAARERERLIEKHIIREKAKSSN